MKLEKPDQKADKKHEREQMERMWAEEDARKARREEHLKQVRERNGEA